MSNMSYCRFQNTVLDLDECGDVLEELLGGDSEALSEEELAASKRLVNKCIDILQLLCDQSDVDDALLTDLERLHVTILEEANVAAELRAAEMDDDD